jgi:hypothetical protein
MHGILEKAKFEWYESKSYNDADKQCAICPVHGKLTQGRLEAGGAFHCITSKHFSVNVNE